MKWFDGEVAEAIAESRRKKLLFVVVVLHSPESSNENTEKMIKLWDAIDESFCEETMVAIRIYHGSEQSKQFAQIYPLPIVPSSYIIDLLGQPLDVITINESMDDVVFMSHLRSACEAAHLSDQIKAKNVNQSSSSTSKQVDSAESGGSKTQNQQRQQGEATESNQNSLNTMSIEEQAKQKEKQARELLKQKHAAEEALKRKEEQQREMERRNAGKLLTEVKLTREEKEIRELAERRRRDKIESEQRLKQLREQIKADREERQRREVRNAPETNVCSINKPDDSKLLLQQPIPSSECRIQCKFPDGSTLVHQFASSSEFSELIDLIKQDGRQKEEFYLVQMYPRREFPDTKLSFLELGLTPSATVLVVTRHSTKNTAMLPQSGSGIMNIMQYLLVAPVQFFFGFVSSLFGYFTSTTTNQQAPSQPPSVPSTTSHRKSESSNQDQSSTRKQDGENIHRFHNENDDANKGDDDDEARWNGNSTQQL